MSKHASRNRTRITRRGRLVYTAAARLVVVSPQDTVFLFRDHNRETGLHWLPPGGGIDPGETPEQAVLRIRAG
ncbi:NUDIX domain-containing protein [Streptomyces sp. 12297]